jgi:hypothetical protein
MFVKHVDPARQHAPDRQFFHGYLCQNAVQKTDPTCAGHHPICRLFKRFDQRAAHQCHFEGHFAQHGLGEIVAGGWKMRCVRSMVSEQSQEMTAATSTGVSPSAIATPAKCTYLMVPATGALIAKTGLGGTIRRGVAFRTPGPQFLLKIAGHRTTGTQASYESKNYHENTHKTSPHLTIHPFRDCAR